MSGKTVRLFTLSVLLMAGGAPASAEMSTESVTVTGSRDAYHDFSKTFATPTPVTGKMARWEHRICPLVVGQNAHYTAFITQHIKYVALAAGAPVNTDASCAPNIEIVFTTTPQALLDTVSERTSPYSGLFHVKRPEKCAGDRHQADPGLVRHRNHRHQGQALGRTPAATLHRQQDSQPDESGERRCRRPEQRPGQKLTTCRPSTPRLGNSHQ